MKILFCLDSHKAHKYRIAMNEKFWTNVIEVKKKNKKQNFDDKSEEAHNYLSNQTIIGGRAEQAIFFCFFRFDTFRIFKLKIL